MSAPERLILRTDDPLQMVDVTDAVAAVVAGAGLADGVASVFCPHTSCGLAVTEAEDGLHADLASVLEELAPVGRAWAHDDFTRRWQNLEPQERPNGWSHVRGLLVTQPSVVLPVLDGALWLGEWQRLFLVELDGPRPARTLVVQAWGRPAPGNDAGDCV
ncbi:MAG: secondary thiamine-phosphate synthase enzyme YjbQ [Actinomycetota bacterium]|nr:secondary thiamine-phosphate synthase enzyme YjbQ [Actinomycetota bacterium]